MVFSTFFLFHASCKILNFCIYLVSYAEALQSDCTAEPISKPKLNLQKDSAKFSPHNICPFATLQSP